MLDHNSDRNLVEVDGYLRRHVSLRKTHKTKANKRQNNKKQILVDMNESEMKRKIGSHRAYQKLC